MTTSQLESVRAHPRRRAAINDALPALMTESQAGSSKMPLRKAETFNAPTTPSTERDPALNVRSLPRRTPTSLEAIAASEQHMASLLERLTLEPEDKQLDSMSGDENKAVDGLHPDAQKMRATHSHGSDSGLGSSVGSVADSGFDEEKVDEDAQLEASAITSSKPSFEPISSARRQLGLGACKQIERYILLPILKESKLKPFHPLAQSVPRRIVNKKITCLRDLERTLLWFAPKFSSSRNAYLQFCEFTIQCLHTSVSHLNLHEQRLPSDRPYTNGYFLDLVSQVRRYAAMVQASRDAAQAAQSGEGEVKHTIVPPTINLEGGLSKNGRPAELVVTEGSTSTSMATGKTYDPESPPLAFKRENDVGDDDEADEGVLRSMARRKKNAPPMDINQKCDFCDKVFKRPCDLTKHEKTHSRPWKCTEPTCRYAQLGWPTEKERDRHVNDRHSETPKLFKCKFEPCTYASKRESNCKQHMEKAHGWVYIRSKNNARGGSSKSSSSVQPGTPSVASTPASKATDIATPISGPSASPPAAPMFSGPSINFNDPPPVRNENFPSLFESSPFAGPSTGTGNDLSSFPTSANLEAFQAQFQAGDPNGLIPALEMHRQSMNSMSVPSTNSVPELMGRSMSFDGSPQATDNTSLNFDLEWSHLDMGPVQEDYAMVDMQFANGTNGLTPYSDNQTMGASQNFMNYGTNGKASGLSPNAQGNLMLYSPRPGAADEHLLNQHDYAGQHAGNDFTLFDQFRMQASAAPARASTHQYAQSGEMFPPLQQDSVFGDVQSWPEHSHQADNSENGLPDMDVGYMGMK